MQSPIRTALISPRHAADHEVVAERLKARWPDCNIRRFASIASLLADENDQWFPDVGVICQSWSDEFNRHDVLQLMATYPLTRWLCSYGPWCDSDGRNRDIWPAPFRVPDAWFDIRLNREAGVLANSLPPLSTTASLAEIFGFHFGVQGNVATSKVPVNKLYRIAIFSPDRAYRVSLLRVLHEFGHDVVHHDVPNALNRVTIAGLRCDAILWDCDPWRTWTRKRLESLHSTSTPIVGLIGLPLADDETELSVFGIKAIVAKLAPAERLIAILRSVTGTPAVRQF